MLWSKNVLTSVGVWRQGSSAFGGLIKIPEQKIMYMGYFYFLNASLLCLLPPYLNNQHFIN